MIKQEVEECSELLESFGEILAIRQAAVDVIAQADITINEKLAEIRTEDFSRAEFVHPRHKNWYCIFIRDENGFSDLRVVPNAEGKNPGVHKIQ